MPGFTSRRSLPLPIGTDSPSELRLSITAMADAVDSDPTFASGTFSARPASSSSLAPRVYLATDVGRYYWDTGVGWTTIMFAAAWTNLTLASGVASVSGFYAPAARIVGDMVFLRGIMQNTGSPISAGSTVATMPAAAVPASKVAFLPNLLGSTSGIQIASSTGVLSTASETFEPGTGIYLDGLSFSLS